MPSEALQDRLMTVLLSRKILLPEDMTWARAATEDQVLRILECVRGFVSECEADSSSRGDWPRANALGDLWEKMA